MQAKAAKATQSRMAGRSSSDHVAREDAGTGPATPLDEVQSRWSGRGGRIRERTHERKNRNRFGTRNDILMTKAPGRCTRVLAGIRPESMDFACASRRRPAAGRWQAGRPARLARL